MVVVRAEAWMVVQATEAALAGVGWVAKMAEAAMVWGRRWWWRRETGRGWGQGDGDWVKGQGGYGGGEGDGGGGDVAAERGKQHVRQTLAAVKAKQMEELQKVASAGGGDEDQGVKAPHRKRAPKTIASRLGRGSTLQRPGRRVTARQRKRAPKTRASRLSRGITRRKTHGVGRGHRKVSKNWRGGTQRRGRWRFGRRRFGRRP